MSSEACHNEIWARLQNGHTDVLPELYDRYYRGLMNYGLRLTGDRELTNDCISRILLRLWDRRKDLAPVHNLQSYLLTCLRNELSAERKVQHLNKVQALAYYRTVHKPEPSYEEYLIQRQSDKTMKEKLARMLEALTPREKELLQLKFFEDLDYHEISIRCRITKRTAYNIVHAALKTLKAHMTDKENISLVYNISLIVLILLFLPH